MAEIIKCRDLLGHVPHTHGDPLHYCDGTRRPGSGQITRRVGDVGDPGWYPRGHGANCSCRATHKEFCQHPACKGGSEYIAADLVTAPPVAAAKLATATP